MSAEEFDSLIRKALPLAFRQEDSGKAPLPSEERSGAQVIPESVGRFRILGTVDEGGVGLILRARDEECERDVAIKLLKEEAKDRVAVCEAFRTEAKTLAGIDHPAIVPVYSRGETADGTPWFAMKLLEGQTFDLILAERKNLKEHFIRDLKSFLAVSRALGYAHSRGLVHMDVKPSNIMVTDRGAVFVIDWGFARGEKKDGSGKVLRAGTPSYMPPEQALGKFEAVGPRSDVFSLGGVLCTLLTGAPVYEGDTTEELILRASKSWTTSALARIEDSEADSAIKDLARRCLSAAPEDRPANGDAVADEIEDWFASLEARKRALEQEANTRAARQAWQRQVRRRVLWVSCVLMLGGIGLWAYFAEQSANQRAASQKALRASEVAVLRARDAQPGSVGVWERALAASQDALNQASTLDADDEHQIRCRDLNREAESGLHEARGVASVASQLSSLWSDQPFGIDLVASAQNIAKAVGLDPSFPNPMQAAAVIREHPLGNELIAGFDTWGMALLVMELPQWKRVIEVARLADEDPLANTVRKLLLERRFEDLHKLATSDKVSEFRPGTLLLLAQHCRLRGDTELAFSLLHSAVDKYPGNLQCCHRLLASLEQAGYIDETKEPLMMSLALRPDDPHMWEHKAYYYMRKKQWNRAISAANQAAALKPTNPSAVSIHVEALLGLNRFKEALELARTTHARAPESQAVALVTAKLQSMRGHRKAALRALEQSLGAMKHRIMKGPILHSKGEILLTIGRFSEAKKCFEEAAKLMPLEFVNQSSLATVLAIEGDDRWRKIVDQVIKTGGCSSAVVNCMQLLEKTGHFEAARDTARTLKQRSEKTGIQVEFHLEAYERAITALCAMKSRYADFVSGSTKDTSTSELYSFARIGLANGDYKQAADLFIQFFERGIDPASWNTIRAAEAAVAMAHTQPGLAADLTSEQREDWDRRAQLWFKQGLDTLGKLVKRNPGFASDLIWARYGKQFEAVRVPESHEGWPELWTRLDGILAGLAGPEASESSKPR